MRRPISSGCKEQMFDQQHQYNDVYTSAVSSSSSTAIHGSTCISSLSSLISINLQVFRRQFGASVQVLHICQQSLLHASSDTAIRYYLIINYNIYVLVQAAHTYMDSLLSVVYKLDTSSILLQVVLEEAQLPFILQSNYVRSQQGPKTNYWTKTYPQSTRQIIRCIREKSHSNISGIK